LLAAPVRSEDLSQFKTADDLWGHVQDLGHRAAPPERAKYIDHLEMLRGAMLEFENRYPSDPRHWDAKLMRVQIESARAQFDGHPPDYAALLQWTKEVGAAPDAPASTKATARYLATRVHLQALLSPGPANDPVARKVVEADIAGLRKDYPDDPRTAITQYEWALSIKARDPAASELLLRELESSQNIEVAAMAQQQIDRLQQERILAKTPLDLKFKAVDGAQVDLAKLRGKVVLVDFWATWCGPCRVEIPNVVAAYNQFHKDGFEIVGVSLDQDKERLLHYTKQAGMTWPEYFDGKMWSNEISARYGINAIPAAWLVDKKGFVRFTEVRGADLAQQVKMLLAE
jgi:thiol-disulfide isomerase/thioredoxin